MIIAKEFPDKEFADKSELFQALRENKHTLISQKKMQNKEADTIPCVAIISDTKGEAVKAEDVIAGDINRLKLDLVINTTNVLDSHGDVHLKGIWNKSVREKKDLYLLQEHKMTFTNIITDEVKANVRTMNWKDFGYNWKGNTEALVFSAIVDKDRNPFMFEQYAKGRVKNHSVGMRYVKLELAINSDSKWDAEEKEVWDKYIDEVANKEEAEANGYFWAVLEAKIIEGSAVPIGSNKITPTLITEAVSDTSKQEPSKDTRILDQLEKLVEQSKN